jgi:hypothetical protein
MATAAVAVLLTSNAHADPNDHSFYNLERYDVYRDGSGPWLSKYSVSASGYGDYSSNWYGYQKLAISNIALKANLYSGLRADEARVKPEIKITGISINISASGSFSEVTNTCQDDTASGSGTVAYYHIAVACTGSSIDLTGAYIINHAGVRYGSTWYNHTVSASYY